MAGAQGLRLKGPFIYKENFRVPLVIVHPDISAGGRQTQALASAVDLAPTLLEAAGLSKSERLERYPALKGHSLLPLLEAPERRVRDALIFSSSIVHCCNPIKKKEMEAQLYARKPGQGPLERRFPDDFLQVEDRSFLRAVFDGRFKFGRYFAPSQHHQPTDLAMLERYNDLELYDTQTDPHELENIAAAPAHRETLLRLNSTLNSLLDAEAGGDDGSYMPGDPDDWRLG
jgi:arylsulfatase A-like enzyme